MKNLLSKIKQKLTATTSPPSKKTHAEKPQAEPPFQLQQIDFCSVDSPLLSFRNNVVSQDGEDGIIEKIFSIIQPENKYCVEFGAWDGKYFSNTWNLIANQQWNGLLIEGNPEKFQDLRKTYSNNHRATCLNRFVEFEGPNSLDHIFAEVGAPQHLDFLSIDIDGTDYFIWESLNQYRPRVLVVEFNPTVPNDIAFVQAKSNSVNQGCSLLALILLGKTKGYELVCATGWNAFFVKKELYAQFNINDNHINAMYKPICDGRIFHGYDSYVYVEGMPRLIWSQTPVDSMDFQVLPQAMRRFGDAQRN